MMQMVDQRINSVVFVVVLSEPMNFLLSISPGKEKLETACMGTKKKSLTSGTFRGSQDILSKLTLKRTKFNSIPRGNEGQAIAQTHKGFLYTANNFIVIACLTSAVAEFW